MTGYNKRIPPKDYSVVGNPTDKLFGVFTALSVMAGVYGVAMIPEIQVHLFLSEPCLLTLHILVANCADSLPLYATSLERLALDLHHK
jgi:hypothetical protein